MIDSVRYYGKVGCCLPQNTYTISTFFISFIFCWNGFEDDRNGSMLEWSLFEGVRSCSMTNPYRY
jgi:hypothetical protein